MNVKIAVLLRAATVPTEVGLAKEAALGQPGPPPITSRGALAEMKSDDNKNLLSASSWIVFIQPSDARLRRPVRAPPSSESQEAQLSAPTPACYRAVAEAWLDAVLSGPPLFTALTT